MLVLPPRVGAAARRHGFARAFGCRARATEALARTTVEGDFERAAASQRGRAQLGSGHWSPGWRPLYAPWRRFSSGQSDHLSQRVAELQSESAQQQSQLERAREVVATLTSTDAMRVTLVAAQAPPQPQGKAIYVRNRSSLIFLASNMPALPPQKIYELWLIPTNGAPIPAGVFKPDARGSATVVEPPLPGGVEAKAFAITVEPEQGSSTPTMPIVMMGAGE